MAAGLLIDVDIYSRFAFSRPSAARTVGRKFSILAGFFDRALEDALRDCFTALKQFFAFSLRCFDYEETRQTTQALSPTLQ
jgi:hypothetical protein